MTNRPTRSRRRLLRAAALGAALLLTGCSGQDPGAAGDGAPQRVVALSTDVAEAALDIAGPDRLVAVPESSTTAA